MVNYYTNIKRIHYPLVAIDLGYSHKNASCGIMHSGIQEPRSLTFGASIKEVIRLVEQHRKLILVIEAVLSTFHDVHGNPDIRGDFEKGRGWYYGAGVLTYAAANRFLRTLHQNVSGNATIYLAEAFLSFKETHSSHSNDALIIFNSFWNTNSEILEQGIEPILDFVEGVPSVKVFNLNSLSNKALKPIAGRWPAPA